MMSLVRSVIRSVQLVDVEPEVAILAEMDRHGFAADEVNHRLVNREAGIGIDHLIALIHQRHDGEEDDGLAAGHDDDLIGVDLECRANWRRPWRWPRANPAVPRQGRNG